MFFANKLSLNFSFLFFLFFSSGQHRISSKHIQSHFLGLAEAALEEMRLAVGQVR